MKRLRQVSWRRFLRGVFGRFRQENGLLVHRLAALRADYNQLKQTNTGLAWELDDLQLRVWELEQQVDELLLYIAEVMGTDSLKAAVAVEEVPDLTWLRLGVVGGHEATQREVINELSLIHGLKRWVVVPPTWECSMKKSVLKEKLERCDLIVLITGYMNHSLTHAVFALKASGALNGKVVLLNFRGKSGVVREVLRHVAALDER